MKTLIIALLAVMGVVAISQTSQAEFVSGYYKSNGTYVSPYVRSDPIGNRYNNY